MMCLIELHTQRSDAEHEPFLVNADRIRGVSRHHETGGSVIVFDNGQTSVVAEPYEAIAELLLGRVALPSGVWRDASIGGPACAL